MTFRPGSGGVVAGMITHRETGEPLPDVRIYIPDLGIGALTNDAGRFMLLNVPAGEEHVLMAARPDLGEYRVGTYWRAADADAESRADELPRAALAPPPEGVGVVTGTIVESATGDPLVDAVVSVAGSGIGARTNDRGRYLLLNVPAGTRTLVIERDGFASERREVEVLARRETTRVDVSLRRN